MYYRYKNNVFGEQYMNLMNKLNNNCIHTNMDIKHNNLDFGHMF